MIARLSGTLIDKQPGSAVVDVGGVGYQVSIPLPTYDELGEVGGRVDLYVHTHVRQDTFALFGFHTARDKEIFVRLLAVNGVGPRTALAVISGLGSTELIESVRARNVTRLSSVPGIGRKTAERILVDLADRLESIAARGGRSRRSRTGAAQLEQRVASVPGAAARDAQAAVPLSTRRCRDHGGASGPRRPGGHADA
ncbi:MAG: Holliday junction branch migration protein RuvA [Acidobacteria bacterium]|nr:MAG: Holliday junction branch migration protein RuvA [Acidobacteriota bacterium]